jgi:methionyl-tRNA formyltransferase
MKIILLCNAQSNQVALANKIARDFGLAGIVIESSSKKKRFFSFSQIVKKLFNRTVYYSLHNSWKGLLTYYKKQYPTFPETNIINVQRINNVETIEFIKKNQPDLIMVSGTSLLRKAILSIPVSKGIINLHTGLSPYMNGGPNCTNWCIAEKKYHLIGNTIMWIDEGIDSGDIITTEALTFNGSENLLQLHIKTMNHAHDLYLQAVKNIREDVEHCPRIKQSLIGAGSTYYTKQWNWKNKLRFTRNSKQLKKYFLSPQYQLDKLSIQTISL